MRAFQTVYKAAVAMVTAAALTACGGGGGGGGNGGGSVVSQGVITAKGSVFVNGIEYSTTGASIKIDDNPNGTDDGLKVGMIVKVKGTKNDDTRKGVATEIEARDALEATIDDNGVDPVNHTITVMGQVIKIEDNVTRLNDDDVEGGAVTVFADLNFQPGERVEINGFPDDNGGLRATRVKKLAGVSGDFEIKGFITNLQTTSFGLSLIPNGTAVLTVNFTAGQIPPGAVDGALVEVKSATKPAGGLLTASLIKLEDRLGNQGTEVEVEGIVASGTVTDFTINGQRVLTNASTVFEGGLAADFALGAKLEAEGSLDANGALVARKISFRSNIKIEGNATNVSETGLTILGQQVRISTATRLDAGVRPAEGSHVEARVTRDRNGDLVATRIKPLSPSTRAFLQGPVTVTGGSMSIIGIPIVTGSLTKFQLSSDSSEETTVTPVAFFARLTSNVTVVKVRWDDFSSLALAVDEAEIELGK